MSACCAQSESRHLTKCLQAPSGAIRVHTRCKYKGVPFLHNNQMAALLRVCAEGYDDGGRLIDYAALQGS